MRVNSSCKTLLNLDQYSVQINRSTDFGAAVRVRARLSSKKAQQVEALIQTEQHQTLLGSIISIQSLLSKQMRIH